jgi:phosphoribosylanthranilate isomerase
MSASLTVKICGLSTPATLEAALDAGADMVGLVFFPPSPRHIDVARARELAAITGARALKVALSVDADDAYLDEVVAALAPDILQLHGRETPARVAAIRARHGLPVNLQCGGKFDVGMPLVDAHPETRFVLDHLGVYQPRSRPIPADAWKDLPKILELAKRPNVVIKVSGACTMSREACFY